MFIETYYRHQMLRAIALKAFFVLLFEAVYFMGINYVDP
jgi:hypothetical protein